MERRRFLTLLGGAVAAASVGGVGYCAGAAGAYDSAPNATGLLWAADFTTADNSAEAGFGNVQTQQGGGSIQNNGSPIPVVNHDELGRCLRLHLGDNGERLEAAPGGGDDLGEGDDRYFRVDFALGPDFPVTQDNPFCLINQIHQASGTGSPPVEFDVHQGALWVRGASTSYNERLVTVEAARKYSLVYRAVLSAAAADSRLEVWVDGHQVLADYTPACPLLDGGNSYWKGATMYCAADIPPLTVYQNAHRVGTSYASVST